MRLVRFVLVLLLALPLFGGDRYIVEFRDGASIAQAGNGIARDRVRREFSRTLNGVAIELREGESIDAIRKLPNVARVTRDTIVEAYGDVATATRLTPRGNAGGSGVVVAVIDTGIDYRHPALGNGFGAGKKIIGGYDFVNEDADPMDDNRHGTHVAGIIAAKSATLNGIAPEVALLAYKVLGANGKGFTSDIIAGIERAIAEHADIINLSLGGPGNPDDPLARAVETAIANGIVVCVAAGNEGFFHAIGSPAGAASAITVGASSGTTTIAEFSTRGPATQSGAIKPDLIAPGVGIVSTVPGGGTMALSGTSMATPYVAALAALLREAHPEWTPARIKAALVATALPIDNEEVMTQGTGLVDRTRAFANDLAVSSTQLNFGLDAVTASAWQGTQRISIRNDGATPRTIHANASGVSNAIAIAFAPAEMTIAPGESRDLDVAITVNNDLLGAPLTESLAFGGVVLLENEQQSLRLPWAFLRAARATITYDQSFPTVMWRRLAEGYESWSPIHPNGIEILLKPGEYDFAAIGEKDGDVRVFIAEQRAIDGDVKLAFTNADAPHEIRFDATMPVATGAQSMYSARVRLLFPDASGSVVLPEIAGRAIHASSFSSAYGLLTTESFVDGDAGAIVIAQHPALQGLSSDVTLHLGTNDYRPQALEVRFNDDAEMHDLSIIPRDWPRRPTEFGTIPPSLRISTSANVWKGILYLSPEVHEDFASGLQVLAFEKETDYTFAALGTPMIRRDARGFFSVRGFEKPELPMYALENEPMRFGDGVLRPGAEYAADGSYFVGEATFRGDRDEARRATRLDTHYRILNAAGIEVSSGEVPLTSQFFFLLPGRGKYRAELQTRRNESGIVTMDFDTTVEDVDIPSFTWLSVHDAAGRHATRLPFNGSGSLVFAAKNISDARTTVFVRRSGFATWVQLTPLRTGDDAVAGTTYRVDLQDALRLQGELDLRIELGDDKGNVTTWQLDRAFASASEPTRTKRRAVR